MKKLAIVLAVIVVILGARLAYPQAIKLQESEPRYQLVPATVPYLTTSGDIAYRQTLFLLNTQGGQIWSYQEPLKLKAPDGRRSRLLPAYFSYVPTDGLNGWDYQSTANKVIDTLNH